MGASVESGRRWRARIRAAGIWRLPRRARAYVVTIDGLALACLIILIVRAAWRPSDAVAALAFVACAYVGIEAFRRIGAPHRRVDRPAHNLLSAFMIPAVLVLPPVYAACTPLALHVIVQVRSARIAPVKRVFNAATGVLVASGAAVIRQALAPSLSRGDLHVLRTWAGAAALLSALLVTLVLERVLVSGIIRAVAPGTPVRELLGDTEGWVLGVVDVCAGVVLGLMWVLSPLVLAVALIPVLILQRAVVHTHLVEASRHDAKTGLANPAWWRQEAGRATNRARRNGQALAVMVMDLDGFKTVNDSYGHVHGDTVLAAVADTLRFAVRPGDLVGRFGGDEFTVLLIGADGAAAAATAERVRARLQARTYPAPGGPALRVTGSIGVALLGSSGLDIDGLLVAADEAMYVAKAAGGNALRVAAVPAPPASGLFGLSELHQSPGTTPASR